MEAPRGEDELQAWRLLGSRGLHWRDDVNDWEDGPGVEDLVDEAAEPVTPPPASKGGPYSFDEEFDRLERERSGRASRLPGSTAPGPPAPSDDGADELGRGGRSAGPAGSAAAPAGSAEEDRSWEAGGDVAGLGRAEAKRPAVTGGRSKETEGAGPAPGMAAAASASPTVFDEGERSAPVASGNSGAPLANGGAPPASRPAGASAGRMFGGRRRGPGEEPSRRPAGPGAGAGGARPGTLGPTASGPSGPVAPPARPGAPAPGATASRVPRRPYDVGAEAGGPGPGRNVAAAVATGLGLAVLFIVCYAIGPGALLALSALAILGCSLEAFAMLQQSGFRPATVVAATGAAGTVLAAYWRGTGALPLMFALVLGASLVWYLARVVEARPVVNVAVTVFGFAWVGVLGSFAGLLLAAHKGDHLFVGAVVPTVVADMAAWLAGTQFGNHQLAPRTSPGKTWEGVVGGAIAALVAGAIIGRYVSPWGGMRHGLELGLVIAVVAPAGDLVQSMVKRDLRLKDSGDLLPGHGGLLDRFDSLLFALPATYYLAVVLHLVR